MKKVSRRKFIVGATAGAAVIGVGAASAKLVSAATGSKSTSGNSGKVSGPVMAYVIDSSKGEVVLLNGTHQVHVNDQDLVNRLVNAAQ